jgi:hypothetical protein
MGFAKGLRDQKINRSILYQRCRKTSGLKKLRLLFIKLAKSILIRSSSFKCVIYKFLMKGKEESKEFQKEDKVNEFFFSTNLLTLMLFNSFSHLILFNNLECEVSLTLS